MPEKGCQTGKIKVRKTVHTVSSTIDLSYERLEIVQPMGADIRKNGIVDGFVAMNDEIAELDHLDVNGPVLENAHGLRGFHGLGGCGRRRLSSHSPHDGDGVVTPRGPTQIGLDQAALPSDWNTRR